MTARSTTGIPAVCLAHRTASRRTHTLLRDNVRHPYSSAHTGRMPCAWYTVRPASSRAAQAGDPARTADAVRSRSAAQSARTRRSYPPDSGARGEPKPGGFRAGPNWAICAALISPFPAPAERAVSFSGGINNAAIVISERDLRPLAYTPGGDGTSPPPHLTGRGMHRLPQPLRGLGPWGRRVGHARQCLVTAPVRWGGSVTRLL